MQLESGKKWQKIAEAKRLRLLCVWLKLLDAPSAGKKVTLLFKSMEVYKMTVVVCQQWNNWSFWLKEQLT